jgi:hypothetical protein
MSYYDKTKLVSLITGLFLIATPISSFSAQGTLDLEFYEQFVSAKIDGVPLETILTEISKKKASGSKLMKACCKNRLQQSLLIYLFKMA